MDDCRDCLQALYEGWRWNGVEFEFRNEWKREDLESSVTDQARTTAELAKAMSSLVSFLTFEGEESGQFHSNKLPTLDTAIWWSGDKLEFEFFEKETSPNMVLQQDTALSESIVRASLNQEVVRRLLELLGIQRFLENLNYHKKTNLSNRCMCRKISKS